MSQKLSLKKKVLPKKLFCGVSFSEAFSLSLFLRERFMKGNRRCPLLFQSLFS